jgi:hypothetical protein
LDYQSKTNYVLEKLNGFVSRSTALPEAIDSKGKGKAKVEESVLSQRWIREEQGHASDSMGTTKDQEVDVRQPANS